MTETIGLVTATTDGTVIASGANDTKPAYTTLGTATADFVAIRLQFGNPTSPHWRHLINVGINGSTVVENISYRGETNPYWIGDLLLLVGGSSGDTIDIQAQTDAGAGVSLSYNATLYSTLPFTPANVSSTYGATESTTVGTTLDPGGVATEVKTEITTSGGLDEATDCLQFIFNSGGDGALPAITSWIVRIYTGATGATDTGIAIIAAASTISDQNPNAIQTFFVDRTVFAASTRVWLGVQCDQASGTIDDDLECVMIGSQITPASAGGGLLRNPMGM